MSTVGTANSQVIDAVTSLSALTAGVAPSQAQALLGAVLTETIGMLMHGAINRQQSAGMMNAAATTSACAKILAVVPPAPPPPPPPPAPAPPAVAPVPGPPGPMPTPALIASAFNDAKAAIDVLRAQAKGADANASTARDDLSELAKAVADPSDTPVQPPTPGPSPAPPASASDHEAT